MSQYICRLRRGWKETDANGVVIHDDWGDYEATEGHIMPLDGELVVEYDNGIPRLKIGDGKTEFSKLPYMSVDSFVLPTKASVTVYPDKWEDTYDSNGNKIENRYIQYVTVENAVVTPNSRIDLQPNPSDLVIFKEKDLAFTAVNAGGNVRICLVGQKPENAYTMQAMVTEVSY